MIQNHLYTSSDKSDFDDNVFDDNTIFNNDDDQSFKFDHQLNKAVNLFDNFYHFSRSKTDSETLHYKPRLSTFHSFNKHPEIFDLPNTDLVQDSLMSFANQSNSSLHFNQSQTSNRNTRTKYDS